MIGTTRSRVSFFMNRFRKLGFIEYDGRIRVHKSLLNVAIRFLFAIMRAWLSLEGKKRFSISLSRLWPQRLFPVV
jgi:hypothetical protein